jgi:N-methylhydantoinase A/oxoprolinase/acetone carboxylase beta subunit
LEYGIRARALKPKPVLRRYELQGKTLSKEAVKGERHVYNKRQWHNASLYEMDMLKPGNEVPGMAIIEAPATTLFVPEGKKLRVDAYNLLWLE